MQSRSSPLTVDSMPVVEKVEYRPGLFCHIFAPLQPPRGTVVLYHGGGWVAGSPEMLYPQARFLVSHGYTAVSVQYRVKDQHRSTVRDAIEDASAAAIWIRARLHECGGSAGLILAGASAGGLLAFHASFVVASSLRGIVLLNPVVDTSSAGFTNRQVPREGDISISPLHMLEAGAHPHVPCLVLHAKDDAVVASANVEMFAAAYGPQVAARWFQNGGHGFFQRKPHHDGVNAELLAFADRHLSTLGAAFS